MPLFDLPLEQLQTYLPPRDEPSDFDSFWATTLEQARAFPLNTRFDLIDQGIRQFDTYDVTFNGYGGQPIKAWFILPKNTTTPLPCVVEYLGYGGGRAFSFNHLHFPAAGYATLLMDTRGQGSVWSNGDTPDNVPDGGNPFYPGFMTQGILDKNSYYYRRVMTDAVRAIEAARSHDLVDASKIAVAGVSQGGGLTLAAAGLMPDVALAMPDVPFLCGYRRATTIIGSAPYSEISNFLKTHRDKIETIYTTLSYFDGINFAVRAQAKALFSVGLMDEICPPSTVYAAYNYYAGAKEIHVYPFNNHEGGGSYQRLEHYRFLQQAWG